MKNYIIPQIIKYQIVDDLLANNNRPHSIFDEGEYLSIENLLQEKFICIVGEPGIGKSRLVEEIKKKVLTKLIFYTASKLDLKLDAPQNNVEYCLIDALDEVDGNKFYNTLQSIKRYKGNNPNIKVLFTCRKHYVASYVEHFASCKELTFIELCRLSDKDLMEIAKGCSETTRDNISKSSKLRELLTIPRYLTFLLEYEEQKGVISNISDLFEFIIGRSIQTAIDNYPNVIKTESIKILIQRVLEKVAFIMEISRRDQISKEELYSILDGAKGNMTQMLIANFDLLFFESRILKDTNGILQFENTELQEYLAAKELCRQDNIESVLYDIAVQKDLRHIYPNWYDVIPHISYKEDNVQTFINIIKLIIAYESNLENNSFELLLRYIDPAILLLEQKEELFSIILEHYLRVPAYIGWKSQILRLLHECYTSKCNIKLKPSVEQLNKIQIVNIHTILEEIVEENKLDKDVSDYWTDVANTLIKDDNEENKLLALNLYNALKDQTHLILLSETYTTFPHKVQEKFYEVTGYRRFTHKDVVDCWLAGCYARNPYAINAVLYIEDPTTMIYAYKRIVEENKLQEYIDPKGALLVYYELYLKKQFNIAWTTNLENKKLLTKVIASFVDNHSYTAHSEINAIVKQILLETETGPLFIGCFGEYWRLNNIFRHFDAEFVDAELLSTLDKLLRDTKMGKWCIDMILTTLIGKIRNDEVKRVSISEYITRYAETFDRLDKNLEEAKKNVENPQYTKEYQSLSDPNISVYAKYEIAFQLSNNIEFIQQQDPRPFVDVITSLFEEVNLDKMTFKKNDTSSFSFPMLLVKLPYYVKALYHLDIHDLLFKHRDFLAKTLPVVCCTVNFDKDEIRNIYKFIVGNISDSEKTELVKWWKAREDDFMNLSLEDIFSCITDYGIGALSYKLEDYIKEYIDNQGLSHSITASKALSLISQGYCNWDLTEYKKLFNALKEDNIESIKMQCNAIMIEKYQDIESIIWRIEYFKNHIVKSFHNETGHIRAISIEESEMTNPNPHMFRCFMNIKGNEKLIEQLFDLFDFALTLCIEPDTQEYSSYLLNQIYLFFVTSNDAYSISELRRKVEKFNTTNVSYLANVIMNNAEMTYLRNEKGSIEKSIRKYNKCIEDAHLEIRNDSDLRRYFTFIHYEVQKEIQDQGIYALVRQETLSEDFIQRELKNTIINKCCQMGLETVRVDREVTLQDNKRTDLLIKYGLCNPIMVELKLLHNTEIQNKKQRQAYKSKFIQYTKATNACLSVFWVFNTYQKGSNTTAFKDLETEYQDLNNTMVLLTDCKCSSGIETGISKDKQTPNQRKSKSAKKKNKKK